MTEDFYQARLRDHREWYCPNGCCRVYSGQTADQKEIEKLERQVGSLTSERRTLTRERAALTSEQRDLARHVAGRYDGANAQKGAFWRGHTAKECDECIDSCPYAENGRGGFRRAWFDGYGADDPAAITEGGDE